MTNQRIPIATLKQLVHLQSSELTTREIGRALNLSQGAVWKYLSAIRRAAISVADLQSLAETELEQRVWQARARSPRRERTRVLPPPPSPRAVVLPDCVAIHTQLKRHKHVTLQLLWEEYHATHGAAALRYSSFCERYRLWVKRLQRSMRQRHYAGEKLFVDYAGRTVPIYGASGREAYCANIFVSALGASGYAYAEATRTATLPDWLGSHVRMLEFYGHAPTILVPDNPRVGVTKADRYEPELQRSYEEMAAHFSIAVIPARPYKPRDKPKVELTVLLVCRWVLARLRHQRFFSLEELNAAIRPLLTELNERPFQKLPGSRRSVFETLDRPAMRALPATPYVYAEWKRVRAAFDYHVDVDRHYYSVPHALVGQELWARFSAAVVEVFHRSQRVASHVRSYQQGQHTTIPEHMPKSHREHAQWTPARLIHWGASIGVATAALVEHLLKSKAHPEQGYRACLGLLSLSRQYGQGRLEAASALALKLHSPTRKSVLSILKTGRDQRPLANPEQRDLPEHSNVRGPNYYH
jgi:transposase